MGERHGLSFPTRPPLPGPSRTPMGTHFLVLPQRPSIDKNRFWADPSSGHWGKEQGVEGLACVPSESP